MISWFYSSAQPNTSEFKGLSDNEKVQFLAEFPFHSLPKKEYLDTITFFAKNIETQQERYAEFYLLYLRYHNRRIVSLPDSEVFSLLHDMQMYAKKHQLKAQYLVANHCILFTKYYKKNIEIEKMYGEIIHEVSEMQEIGLASFKAYDLDDIFYHNGKFMYYLGEDDKAIEYLKIAEQYVDENFHTHILVLNLIQSIYQRKKQNTDGIIYGKKIIAFADTANKKDSAQIKLANQWKGIAWLDIAAMLVEEGKFSEGESYANQAYPFVKAKTQKDLIAEFEALSVLVSIQLKQNNVSQAGAYLKRMDLLYKTVGQSEYLYFKKIKYFDLCSQYYQNKRQYERAFYYTNLAAPLKDSLEKRTDADKLKAVAQKIITQQYSEKIALIERQKNTQKWLKNAAIGLLLLSGFLALINYKRIKVKQQLAMLKLNQAQTDLENYVNQLHEKVSMVEQLEIEIGKLTSQGQNVEYLHTLRQTTILTEEDWVNFKALFERVYPTFIAEQLQHYPDLTAAELRLLLLQKLNLSTAEMANMLGVQRNTINQTWTRVRKKTGEYQQG